MYYEDAGNGDAAIEVQGRNYQQFVLALLRELEEAGIRDGWVGPAEAARFAHTPELVAVLDQDPYDGGALDALTEGIGANPNLGADS